MCALEYPRCGRFLIYGNVISNILLLFASFVLLPLVFQGIATSHKCLGEKAWGISLVSLKSLPQMLFKQE